MELLQHFDVVIRYLHLSFLVLLSQKLLASGGGGFCRQIVPVDPPPPNRDAFATPLTLAMYEVCYFTSLSLLNT